MWTPYTYLLWSSILLAISALLIAISPRKSRTLVLAGLFSATYSLASVLFVPHYWNPIRLGDPLVGFEDLAFSFANGVIVWWLASLTLRRGTRVEPSVATAIRRYIHCSGFGLTATLIAWTAGLEIMPAFWLSMVLLFVFFLLKHPWYWRLAFAGALGFTTLYGVFIVTIFQVDPHFAAQWSVDIRAGWQILEVPVEEFIWAFGFGAVFPMLAAFAFDARREEAPG